MEYLSKEAYNKIADELNNLITVEFPKVKDALSEARAQGDLSENYEYRAARRAQGRMISRIRYLQRVLEYARVIDENTLPHDKVGLLSKVEVTNLSSNSKMTVTVVSPHEANLEEFKISINSAIGQALMGHKVGETVEVHAPAATFKLRIESISLG